MAYSALPTKASGDTFDLTTYNKIKANFEAGIPDLYTTKGDLAPASAADTAVRLAVGANRSGLVADSTQTVGMRWQIRPSARVYNSGAIDPATSTDVALTFDSERHDTDAMHSTSVNTGRLTVPSGGAGIYSIGGNVLFDSSAGSNATYFVNVRLNGTTTIASNTGFGVSGAIDILVNVNTQYSLAVNDYVELVVYTTQDVNVNASGNQSPEFWATWIAPAP